MTYSVFDWEEFLGQLTKWISAMRGCARLAGLLLLLVAGAARGEGCGCTAADLERQAEARSDAGDFDAATVLRRRAVTAARAEAGPGSAPAALAEAGLAHLYIERERYLDAEPLLLAARLDLEMADGPADPALAPVLSDLARLAMARGTLTEAEALARRSVAIAPAATAGLRGLGAVLAAERDFGAATAVLDRALAQAGSNERDRARSLSERARLDLRQDRYTEALPLIEQAIALDQHFLPADHPLLAADWYDLGVALLGLQRVALAERVLRIAIDRLEHGGERGTPRAANIGLGLARALHTEGRGDEARLLFDKAQQILGQGEAEERRRERHT